jgi:NAD+ synthase
LGFALKLTPSILDLDWAEVEGKIRRFIKDYVEKSGANGIVLGISGGVDSSTAAALSALAIGGDKVLGLILPEKETRNERDIEHAQLLAKNFGFKNPDL